MKTNRLLIACILLAFTVNLPAQSPEPAQPAAPTQSATTAAAFELNGVVDAKLFVPASMMAGNLHSVSDNTYNDGLRNFYLLTSGGRTQEVSSTPLLIKRINEIYALDYLRGVSKTDEFAKALGAALGNKVDSVVGVVNDPVGTVRNLPRGASRFFGGIGEALKGGRSENEGRMLDKISGTNKAKAALAIKLGVSPYTDNQELQDQLTQTARAMAGGGLVLDLATVAATGGAGVALTVIGVNQTLQDALVNTSPDDLRILNRKKLFALGISRELADDFLMHPQYTPWQETITTDALSRIGANPKAFLKQACTASSQEDASYFQRLAQLLLQYHQTAAPLLSIRMENGLVCALDRNGILVIPVSLDYGIWSARVAGRADELGVIASGSKDIKGFALWTDGQLSARLCAELQARNITWKVLALGANQGAGKQ